VQWKINNVKPNWRRLQAIRQERLQHTMAVIPGAWDQHMLLRLSRDCSAH
jgi:hypothetical protein